MDVSSFHSQATCSLNHLAHGVVGDLGPVTLPVRRWQRRPVDALERRTLCESDVAVRDSGIPDFGKKGRPQKVEQLPGWFGKYSNKKRKSFSLFEKNPALERSIPIGSRPAALKRETHRTQIGTEGSGGSKRLKTIFAVLRS